MWPKAELLLAALLTALLAVSGGFLLDLLVRALGSLLVASLGRHACLVLVFGAGESANARMSTQVEANKPPG